MTSAELSLASSVPGAPPKFFTLVATPVNEYRALYRWLLNLVLTNQPIYIGFAGNNLASNAKLTFKITA